MSYGLLDDRFWCHRKVEALAELGPQVAAQATGLWCIALSFASFHDDPEVTIAQVRRLVPWRPKRGIDALVSVGLWIEVEPGARWRFHDWKDHRGKRKKPPRTGGESTENLQRNARESPEKRERIAGESHTPDPRNHSTKPTHQIPSTKYQDPNQPYYIPPPPSETPGARAEEEAVVRHRLGLAAKVAFVEAFRRRGQDQQPRGTAQADFEAIGALAQSAGGTLAETLTGWAEQWLTSGSTRLRTPGAWLAWCNAQQSGGWRTATGSRGMAPPAPIADFADGDTRTDPESFMRETG